MAVGQDDGDRVGKTDDEACVDHLGTSGDELLGGAVDPVAVGKSDDDGYGKEHSGELGVAPAKQDRAGDNDDNGA